MLLLLRHRHLGPKQAMHLLPLLLLLLLLLQVLLRLHSHLLLLASGHQQAGTLLRFQASQEASRRQVSIHLTRLQPI
jgi:hypothetical protein